MGFLDYNEYMGMFGFNFESKQESEQRLNDYTYWAYPYGEKQKKTVEDLAISLMPKLDKELAIYNYLNCKQALIPKHNKPSNLDLEALPKLVESLRDLPSFDYLDDIYKCIALVEADINTDENLYYPSADMLLQRAEQIKNILR